MKSSRTVLQRRRLGFEINVNQEGHLVVWRERPRQKFHFGKETLRNSDAHYRGWRGTVWISFNLSAYMLQWTDYFTVKNKLDYLIKDYNSFLSAGTYMAYFQTYYWYVIAEEYISRILIRHASETKNSTSVTHNITSMLKADEGSNVVAVVLSYTTNYRSFKEISET